MSRLPPTIHLNPHKLNKNKKEEVIAYNSSETCPDPPDAGNLSLGADLTPGSSSAFFLASDAALPWDPLYQIEEMNNDWESTKVVLEETTAFVHISSLKLPPNLTKGTKIRTSSRVYAHTDTKQWLWKGADRVYIRWTKKLPFQIMGNLGSRGLLPVRNAEYSRSCRFLNSGRQVVLKPGENGRIEWPYANVAVSIPPAYFEVTSTPEPVLSPKQYLLSAIWEFSFPYRLQSSEQKEEYQVVINAREVPFDDELGFKKNPRTTFFSSPDKAFLERMQGLFPTEGINQLYSTKLSSEVVEERARKRALYVIPVDVDQQSVRYTLEVKRTSEYNGLVLTALNVDMSSLVVSGRYDPANHVFEKYFYDEYEAGRMNSVLVDSRLAKAMYVSNLGDLSTMKNVVTETGSQFPQINPFTDSNINDPLFENGTENALSYAMRISSNEEASFEFQSRGVEFITNLVRSFPSIDLDSKARLPIDGQQYLGNVFDFAVHYAYEGKEQNDLLTILMNRTPRPRRSLYQRSMELADGDGKAELLKFMIDTLGMSDIGLDLSNYHPEDEEEEEEDMET